jgi:hypothetical protein
MVYNTINGTAYWRIDANALVNLNGTTLITNQTPTSINLFSKSTAFNSISVNGIFDDIIVRAISNNLSVSDEKVKNNVGYKISLTNNLLSVFIPDITNFAEIKLHDIHGRELKSYNTNEEVSELDVNNLPTGLYILNISTSQRRKALKFNKL